VGCGLWVVGTELSVPFEYRSESPKNYVLITVQYGILFYIALLLSRRPLQLPACAKGDPNNELFRLLVRLPLGTKHASTIMSVLEERRRRRESKSRSRPWVDSQSCDRRNWVSPCEVCALKEPMYYTARNVAINRSRSI
jgi:hypothetical protein